MQFSSQTHPDISEELGHRDPFNYGGEDKPRLVTSSGMTGAPVTDPQHILDATLASSQALAITVCVSHPLQLQL